MNNDELNQTNVGIEAQELENIKQGLEDAEDWGATLEDRFSNVRTVERDFFDLLGTYARGVDATEKAVNNAEGIPLSLQDNLESISNKRDRLLLGKFEEGEEGYFDPETQSWNKGIMVNDVVRWGPEASEKALYGVERLDGELDQFLDDLSEVDGVSYNSEEIRRRADSVSPEEIEYVAIEDASDDKISRRALLGGAGVVVAGLWARGTILEGQPDVWTEDGLPATEYSLVDREPDRIQDYVAAMQGEEDYQEAFSEVQAQVELADSEMGFAPQHNRIDFETNLGDTADMSVLMEDRFYDGARSIYDNID